MEESTQKSIDLKHFKAYLQQEEKSPVTVEKYLRDTTAFAKFAGTQKR